MPTTRSNSSSAIDFRNAGKEQLSLALIDARNHALHLAAQFEKLPDAHAMALRLLGHVAWFQEWWIARNVQRNLGADCNAAAVRLASIDPMADAAWRAAPETALAAEAGLAQPPDASATRNFMLETLESTLELLEKADESDAKLYFFRLALFHEDWRCEELLTVAQVQGLELSVPLPGPAAQREPLLIPASRWRVGSESPGGFAFDNEQPAFDDPVPEFEIDAHAVCWAQFVEFVDDGGYDQENLWHPDGWQWLAQKAAQEGRRAPRFVDQIGVASGAVMQTRFGKARRMMGGQCVTHVSWFEADAWARWAGRRLPAEVEWEVAAHVALRRGFHWGDVWEWTASTFRPYPGFTPGPWADHSQAAFGSHKVLRGASFATTARVRSPKFRRFALPHEDAIFCGFRTCAI
jgi:gamma-glutamyl hercynylcysteine S-oxide synthase